MSVKGTLGPTPNPTNLYSIGPTSPAASRIRSPSELISLRSTLIPHLPSLDLIPVRSCLSSYRSSSRAHLMQYRLSLRFPLDWICNMKRFLLAPFPFFPSSLNKNNSSFHHSPSFGKEKESLNPLSGDKFCVRPPWKGDNSMGLLLGLYCHRFATLL